MSQNKPDKKEFSILKWLIFPGMSVMLAAIIAWFNLTVFGQRDGLVYLGVVAMILFFSIVINYYVASENRSLAIGAFVAEIFLILALIINAAYSMSVQRAMSVARQAETARQGEIDKISKLDRRAQRTAVKTLSAARSADATFSENERILFWIMIGELVLYGVCAFSLYAIAQLLTLPQNRSAAAVSDADQEDFPRRAVRSPSPAFVMRSDGAHVPRTSQPTADRQRVTWRGGRIVNGLDRDEAPDERSH